MDAIFTSTYEPMPLPALSRRPSIESISRDSSYSSPSSPSSPRPSSPPAAKACDSFDVSFAKDTIGLPIFFAAMEAPTSSVSHLAQAAAPVSTPAPPTPAHTTTSSSSAQEPTSAPSSPNAGHKFSNFFHVARTSLDSLVRKSATFLLEESDDSALVIEWRWEAASPPREGRDNAMLDKDGWVEGWLD